MSDGRIGPIIDAELIRSLFAPDELEHWFGTSDIRDDDGTGHDGTLIPGPAAEEIARRLRSRPR